MNENSTALTDADPARGAARSTADEPVWGLTKALRHARCILRPHPLGLEVRVHMDGEPYFTHVHRDRVGALGHAVLLQHMLRSKGWVDAP